DGDLGTVSLGIMYASFTVFSLFASSVVRKLGSKNALLLATTGYWLYTMVPASLYLGFASAILWVGQGTYLTSTARSQASEHNLHEGNVIGHYNGEFWGIYASHQLVGNLLTLGLLKDGAEGSTSGTTLLFTVFLGSMALGTVLMSFLKKRDGEVYEGEKDSSHGFYTFLVSLWKQVTTPLCDTRLLLIVPLIAYSGLQQAFVWAEFTEYYVQPSLGESGVGGAMAVYGAFDTICSLAAGRFTSGITSITLIVSGGAFLQSGILIWLLNYSEPIGVLRVVYLLFIAAIWGIGDGVLMTQLNALLAMLFKHNMEGAFAQLNLWQSASIAVVFFLSPYVSLQTMLFFMLAALVLSFAGFIFLVLKVEKLFSNHASQQLFISLLAAMFHFNHYMALDEESPLVDNPIQSPNQTVNHGRDIHILSWAFLLIFLAYGAAQNLQSTLNTDGDLGTISLGILYTSFTVSSIFASSVVRMLGSKNALVMSTTGYWLYIAANLKPSWYTLVPASLYLGFAAAILWVAEGTYLTLTARSQANDRKLHEGTVIGRFNGEFWGIFACHQLVGNLLTLALLKDGAEGSTSGTTLLFTVFLGSMTLGTVLMSFLNKRDGEETERNRDSSLGFYTLLASLWEQLITPLRDIRLLLIVPLIAFSGLQLAAEFTKFYVQPSLGESGVGGAMAVYGAFDAICSLAAGRFTSGLTSIALIVSGGTFLEGGTLIWLLNYSEPRGVLRILYPLLIAAILGIGNGVLMTQLNALLGILFKHNMEGTFAQLKLWQCASIAVVFFLSPYISVQTMLFLMLAALVLSLAGFLFLVLEVEKWSSICKTTGTECLMLLATEILSRDTNSKDVDIEPQLIIFMALDEETPLVDNPIQSPNQTINHGRDIHILSWAFLLIFLAYGAAQNLQSTLNTDGDLGTISLGILYTSFTVSSLFASSVVKTLGSKNALLLGTTGYWLYIAANLKPSWYTMVPASLYLGFAAAILWVGEGTYLTSTARSQANDHKLHEGTVIGHFNGEFWGIFATHQLVGNLLTLVLLKDGEEGSTSGTTLLFTVFLGSMTLGTVLMSFLKKRDGEETEGERDSSNGLYTLIASLWKQVITPLCDMRAEFTKYYVQPSLGESGVGGAMAVYGVFDAICSLAAGRFTSGLTSITLIVSGGAFLQGGILIWLLNYSEPTGALRIAYPLLIAAIWGIGDGVLMTQLNALLAMLFKHNMEGTFAQLKLWQSASIAVVFFLSPYISLQAMLFLMLAALILSLAGFLYLVLKVEKVFSNHVS
ncbi:hypothetical protein M8C21_011227, partial [Ambrosia artemisiifolia]